MKIEEAIQKAIEGGWKSDLMSKPLAEFEIGCLNGVQGREIGIWFYWGVRTVAGSVANSSAEILAGGIFLDPSFWQSLSKTLGWTDEWDEINQRAYKKSGAAGVMSMEMFVWCRTWHRFINHLADGKTAEEFFDALQ